MGADAPVWSTVDGVVCIRVLGDGEGRETVVRPRAVGSPEARPGMAGTIVDDGTDRCFIARYPFVEGTEYEVVVGGVVVGVLEHPRSSRAPVARVVTIHPTSASVPLNLLRFYVTFSAPMGEGSAARHVRLVDESGVEILGALLEGDYELWDADRRRLTLLLDPGRIKRGLAHHEASGYPLRPGGRFSLLVDEEFVDSAGTPLARTAKRDFLVAAAEYRSVTPTTWIVDAPAGGTRDELRVTFDRAMDGALLGRCLAVTGPTGSIVPGSAGVGAGEGSWIFTPDEAWAAAEHLVRIDPVLEDTTGNSIARVFDRELGSRPEDGDHESPVTALPFRPLP